ncbi:MAG TPA: LysR family transcriptional regulator [Gemmatimonadaceae bacterium]|nr:LysR family transcriptional regulator [Gemmatimonadaceae bacterium]
MALNLNALRIFAAVADAGGFTKASELLHLSQPAVSKAVQTLERDLAMPLLERGPRAIHLTDAGTALFARARELFAVERGAEEELRALRGLEGGRVRIGASTTIATYMLPPVLADFRTRHPAVKLTLVSANTRAIAALVLERRVDVALVEGPVADARLELRRWRADELVVIVPAGHRLARRRSVQLAQLAAEPFIVRERGSGTRDVAERAFAAHGIHPPVALTLASTEAIKQAVAAGLGLAVVSRAAAGDQIALGHLAALRIAGFEMRRDLTELRLRGRTLGAPAEALAKLLHSRAHTS